MNDFLLVKWIWKIVKGSEETWYKLLQAKYMPEGNFFKSKTRGTSQFGQWLHKVKHLFKWGATYNAKKGDKIMFWEDVWLGNTPLKLQFPSLYNFSKDPEALVEDYYDSNGWDINFRRTLTVEEAEQRSALFEKLQEVCLEPSASDEVNWALDKSKSFTTKSLYRFISHGGVCVADSRSIWRTKLPLKIKVFLWQLSFDKLQTATALKKREWRGSIHCCLCGGKKQ
jgi:hypothetical protein